MKRKAQTSLIMILMVIIIFVGSAVFLISFAGDISQTEYINLYAHNLLASVLKTDTGLTDPQCRTMADVLTCSFVSPSHICGAKDCYTLADERLNDTMNEFSLIKRSFRYLFVVEPQGFVALSQGQQRIVELGDASLLNAKTDTFVANQRAQQILGGQAYILNFRLVIAKI